MCTPEDQTPESKRQGEQWPSAPLDIKQAAAYLNVNERYMRLLVAEQRVAYLKLGRLLRFRVEDLDAYLEDCRIEVFQPHRFSRRR